jgi:two-component system nitrate/nitrite response regulator NarP
MPTGRCTVPVVVADDHPMMLSGVIALLENTEFEVVATVSTGEAALEAVETMAPEILICDVRMPGMSGVSVLKELRSRQSSCSVVLLTGGLTDPELLEAVKLNADGVLLKDAAPALLMRCLEEVRQGRAWMDRSLLEQGLSASMDASAQRPLDQLTPRELDVARLVAEGKRNLAIAQKMGVTEGSVKVYLSRIYEKTGLGSRTELALCMARSQLPT